MRLTLPLPPSVNNLFATVAGGRRIKSERYLQWIEEAGWSVQMGEKQSVQGPYRLAMLVPSAARADLDNLIKPVLDLLVKMGRVWDDKHVQKVSCERSAEVEAGQCIVIVEAAT